MPPFIEWTDLRVLYLLLRGYVCMICKASISGDRFWRICVYILIASQLRKPNLRNLSWKLTQPITSDRSLNERWRWNKPTYYAKEFTCSGQRQWPGSREQRRLSLAWWRVGSLVYSSYQSSGLLMPPLLWTHALYMLDFPINCEMGDEGGNQIIFIFYSPLLLLVIPLSP